MTEAKRQALEDIMNDLKKEGKCFIAFRKKLNPTMGSIVRKYINMQFNKNKNK